MFDINRERMILHERFKTVTTPIPTKASIEISYFRSYRLKVISTPVQNAIIPCRFYQLKLIITKDQLQVCHW